MVAVSSSSGPAGFALVHLPPGVGLGGLVTHPENAVLGGILFAISICRDFRAHGPCNRIDRLAAPSGGFVARVSAAVTTAGRRPSRGGFPPAADTAFTSFFAAPSEGGTGSAEAPAATAAVAQHAPSPTRTSQGNDSAAITDPAASAPSPPGDPALRLPFRLRVASLLGRADAQRFRCRCGACC